MPAPWHLGEAPGRTIFRDLFNRADCKWDLKNKTNKQNRSRLIDTEDKLTVARLGVGD